MTIGEKVKEARLQKGWTQQELAEKLGYKSRSSINKIEVGDRDVPRKQIIEIAKALEVKPAYLMGWGDEPNKKSAPTETDEDDKTKNIKEKLSKLSDADLVQIDDFITFLLTKSKSDGE